MPFSGNGWMISRKRGIYRYTFATLKDPLKPQKILDMKNGHPEEIRTEDTTQNGYSIPEVSIVMPCLNAGDTLEARITKANRALAESSIACEVIVADNGSRDGSPEIAQRLRARVVRVEPKGYGHALMAGIGAARGRFVIMGDADDSYDFGEIPTFVGKLRQGFDLVLGCRFPSGGGRIEPGRDAAPASMGRQSDALTTGPADVWWRCA